MRGGIWIGTVQSQEKPVVVPRRVVETVEVRDQRTESSAELKKLVPVLVRAREPRDLDAQNDAHVVEGYLC